MVDYNELVSKFFAGEISDSELDQLLLWLDSDPENRRIFNQENEVWQEASFRNKLENYKNDSAWLSISSKLELGKGKPRSVTVIRKNYFRILVAAASVICLLAIGGVSSWFISVRSYHQISENQSIIETNEGEKAHVILPDSSEIYLNSGSRIQYISDYNLFKRTVQLSGEAYFVVSTNKAKPFVVKSNDLTVTATGTRFNIFSFPNENRVETTMEEGKIDVSVKGQAPINVKAGQQVVYNVKNGDVFVHDVNPDTYTSWRENKLLFFDTPFEEVLRKVGRKYNVTFEVAGHDLMDLKFTATFIDESIEEVMQMLKTVSPVMYKIHYRTSVSDKEYHRPRIVIWKRKQLHK
jgi:transmembrane sensor